MKKLLQKWAILLNIQPKKNKILQTKDHFGKCWKWSSQLQCFFGDFSISQRLGIISLIPKKNKDPLQHKNWCPIALLNVDYKLATKCIARRLEKVPPHFTARDQVSCFFLVITSSEMAKTLIWNPFAESKALYVIMKLIETSNITFPN